MKLSEFGINKTTTGLSNKILEVMKVIQEKGETLLEWDVDNLVFDKDFIVEQMYISNTASEKELPQSIRNIAIKVDGVSNLTIDGMGNSILFDNRQVQIAMLNCENIIFKNFVLDYVHPTVAEFTVVNKGLNYVDIAINQDTLYAIKGGKLYFLADDKSRCVIQECNPNTGVTHRVDWVSYSNHNVFNNKKCKALENGLIRVFNRLKCFEVGNIYQLAWIRRDGTGFFMDCSKNITIDNCRFKFMHGMGVLAQRTENINITNTDFLPNKDRGRTTVAFADVMHFVNCKGTMNIQNVKADGTRDDIINNHGVHFKIEKVVGNKICCKFKHPQTYGFNCFFEGDEIEFIEQKSLQRIGACKVKASKMLNPRVVEIEIEDIEPNSVIGKNVIVENVTWTAALHVDNLEVFNDPTRGILVTTRRPVVIKNCKFHKCYMPCVHISDDARSWYESGYCTDVTIENNFFDNCLDYALSVHPENFGSQPVHKNIKIVNNKIVSDNGKILTAKCAENLVFEGNTIETNKKVIVKTNNLINSNIKY